LSPSGAKLCFYLEDYCPDNSKQQGKAKLVLMIQLGSQTSELTKSCQDFLIGPGTGTGGRDRNGLYGFASGDGAGADRAATLGAQILMKLTGGQYQKQSLAHGLRALALGTVYFAGREGAKLLTHVT
jgi:hypothetical protein